MKSPSQPCYSCSSDNLRILSPNRWHNFAVVCLNCGEFGEGMSTSDDAVDSWDRRCEAELRERARAPRIPDDDRKALPSEVDRSQLRCTAEEAELLKEQLVRIGMAKP